MRTLNVHDAKTNFSRLLADVERGETLTIARAGKPVARLVPIGPESEPSGRRIGMLDGQMDSLIDAFESWTDADQAELEAAFYGNPLSAK